MTILLSLAAAVALLGLLALAGIVFQLLRQQGALLLRLEALELHARGADAPAAAAVEGVAEGAAIGPVRLPDATGEVVDFADIRGRRLLVHWNPGCGFCEDIAPLVGEHAASLQKRGIQVVLVSWGNVEEVRRQAEEHGIDVPILLQDGSQPVSAFAGLGTPVGYLVGEDGRTERPLIAGSQELAAVVEELDSENGLPRQRSIDESSIQRNGLSAGTRAPDFELPDIEGRTVSLSDFRDRPLLLVFSDPNCGPCNALAPKLAELDRQADGELAIVMISRGSPEENVEKARAHNVAFPILLQPGWRTSKQYAIFETPVGYLIDADGVIAEGVARGGDAILALADGWLVSSEGVMREQLAHV